MHEIENIGIGAMRQHWEIRFISLALGKTGLKVMLYFVWRSTYHQLTKFDFEILSLNTRGIGGQMNSPKRRKVFNYLKKHSSSKSIIFLQETHGTERAENEWTNQRRCGRGSIFFSHGTSDTKCVLIAFREALEIKVKSIFRDKNGRYLILKAIIQNKLIVLVNYYAPNDEGSQISTLSVMNEIINQLELDPNTAIVWGEDFNLIFDTNLDADGGKPQLKVNSLSKLLSITEENDLFRVRCPNGKRFTWQRKNPFKQRRLDYFFISDTLQDIVERIEIFPSVQYDNSTLCLKFSPINERNRGPSHWKFNNFLVYDKKFVSMMKTEIPKFCDESLHIKDAMGR